MKVREEGPRRAILGPWRQQHPYREGKQVCADMVTHSAPSLPPFATCVVFVFETDELLTSSLPLYTPLCTNKSNELHNACRIPALLPVRSSGDADVGRSPAG